MPLLDAVSGHGRTAAREGGVEVFFAPQFCGRQGFYKQACLLRGGGWLEWVLLGIPLGCAGGQLAVGACLGLGLPRWPREPYQEKMSSLCDPRLAKPARDNLWFAGSGGWLGRNETHVTVPIAWLV